MKGPGVAILAGGLGERLRSLTGDGPKALAPFLGRTLLDHQLERVSVLQPERVVVLACHQAERIREHLGGRAELLVEAQPLGTAGGLHLLPPGPERWLSLNVDHISDVDLVRFAMAFEPPCTACLWEVSLPVDEGVVELSQGRLIAWKERPVLKLPVTTGLYTFSAHALRQKLDGRRKDMPALVEALMPEGVKGWLHEGTWIDAGTPERLARAEAWVAGLASGR